jgi:hypothetical protein
MQKSIYNRRTQSSDSEVETFVSGNEVWAQYKLELLIVACKQFLNELHDKNSTRTVEEVVAEFKAIIDATDQDVHDHGSVVDLIGSMQATGNDEKE